jgi:hypothetical protein
MPVIRSAVSELRRELGPTAWLVLEEMLLRSTGTGECCTAAASIRKLGASLGLAKDTVGPAIRRLQIVGIVVAEPARTPSGTFDARSYRFNLPTPVSYEHTHATETLAANTHTTLTHTTETQHRGRVAPLDPALFVIGRAAGGRCRGGCRADGARRRAARVG